MFQKFQQRVLRNVGECIFYSKILTTFLQFAYYKDGSIDVCKDTLLQNVI